MRLTTVKPYSYLRDFEQRRYRWMAMISGSMSKQKGCTFRAQYSISFCILLFDETLSYSFQTYIIRKYNCKQCTANRLIWQDENKSNSCRKYLPKILSL